MTAQIRESEIREFLGAIRDVEAALDRHAERASGAMMMVWGLVCAVIFSFYQLVAWNPAPYAAALGPLLDWVWALPTALGYVASFVLGARVRRRAEDPGAVRRYWRVVIPGVVSTAIVVAIMLFGDADDHWRVPGALVLVLGVATLALCPPLREPGSRIYHAIGASAIVGGAALAASPPTWASLAAALFYGVGLIGMGTARYLRNR